METAGGGGVRRRRRGGGGGGCVGGVGGARREGGGGGGGGGVAEPVRLVPVAGTVCFGFEPRRVVLAGVRFRTRGWLRGAAPDAEGEDACDDAGSPGAFIF